VVATSEAPLGRPASIASNTRGTQITLAIESVSYSQISRRLGKRTKMIIRGHRAACGRLGRQLLFVRLKNGPGPERDGALLGRAAIRKGDRQPTRCVRMASADQPLRDLLASIFLWAPL
jgi:hypothetical protein